MSAGSEHRFFEGPFQPDLEDRLTAEVGGLRRSDPLASIILLVGSNLLGLHLTRLLARRLGGVIGLRVMTFIDLARAVAAPTLDRDRLRPSSEAGERLLARAACTVLPVRSYFQSIVRKSGFEDALLAALRDLREGGIGPAQVRKVFGRRSPKMRDLAALLEAYETELRRCRLIDRPGILAEAVRLLDGPGAAAALPPPIAGATRLLMYGVYDFNWMQKLLLQRLLRLLPASVFFPWRDSPAFEYARPARTWFESLGLRPGSSGSDEVTCGPAATGAAAPAATGGAPASLLARAQANLFRPPADEASNGDPPETADPSLRIIAAPGEPREVLEAARAVLDLARAGVPFEEMAILHRGGDAYPRLLPAALSDLGIPFFQNDGRPLRPTRAARALLALFDLKETDYERSRVTDFLALAGALDQDATAGGPADWDLLSRLAGITSGRRAWIERLDRLAATLEWRARQYSGVEPEAEPPHHPRLLEEARRLPRLFARLAESVEGIPREGSWTALARALTAALLRFLPPSPDRTAVLESIAGLTALEKIQGRTTLSELRRLLEFDLDRRARPAGRFQAGHLMVGDVLQARGLRFRTVVLLGMVEGSFPAPARQDPILLDDERLALDEAAGGHGARLAVKARRSLEERLLFTLAAASASERLLLTFPHLDPDSARERVPSSFLLYVVEAATGRSCDYQGLLDHPGLTRVRLSDLTPVDRARAVREREFDLAVAGAGARARDPAVALLPALRSGAGPFAWRGLGFEQARWASKRLTPFDGVVGSPRARALLERHHALAGTPVSPTRLEQYMTCPYQYFGERILGLAPQEAPEQILRLSPLDRGSLMHGVLHELFAVLRRQTRLPLRPAEAGILRAELGAILRRRFEVYEARGLAGLPVLARIDLEGIERDLLRMLQLEIDAVGQAGQEGLCPAHFEVRFGMPATPPEPGDPPDDPLSRDAPALLPDDKGLPLMFKGQIDRIDLSSDGRRARVIDYKSGRIDGYRDDSHGGGTALQLPVYILAAEALLPATRVEEAVYQSIARRGGFDRVRFGREAWDGVRTDLLTIGRIVQDGVASGAFFHVPDEKAQCKFCEVKSLCGQARVARFKRKREDPIAAPFLAFKASAGGGT